ncbi:MAG: alpha/beta hydrolase [Rhizobiales bacterium PAR1]|nr:MAG: alpha/beta hydrolase [Rhizobiales bacterium PAR1]
MVDYEVEYNNRARVPEHPVHIAAWASDAATYRAITPHEAGISYGPSAKEAYDFFPAAGGSGGPVILFIHGGYWQALDRAFFSHMAKGPNASGLSVAVMSYGLCPEISMATIVDQVRACALAVWRKTGRKIVAAGHSAGGHLTAMLLATDWRALDPAAPADLVSAGLSISGLFELEPLVGTSINTPLKMDIAEARRLSPLSLKPNAGTRHTAFVGGAESAEYLRQSRTITDIWGKAGCKTAYAEIAGANHFTVIAGFAEARSELTDALVALASA